MAGSGPPNGDNMNYALEAVVARVVKTLDMIWPGARVVVSPDPQFHSIVFTCKTEVQGLLVVTNTAIPACELHPRDSSGIFDYLMERLPRDHCASIVDAAITAAKHGRYSSHTDLRDGFR